MFKEYPENNPLGLRWVELKAQEGDDARQALQDALKYEGDTMGHCVGGYCDDVFTGRSRIYSLRDAKGQPHVTIETAPNTRGLREYLQQFEHPEKPGRLSPDALGITDTLYDYVQANRLGNGDLDSFGLETLKRLGHPLPPDSIIQIKGKQNRAPNPEYLPFVQDFVKSGKWSDVGDLQNVGARLEKQPDSTWAPAREVKKFYLNQPDGSYTPYEHVHPRAISAAGFNPEGKFSAAEMDAWLKGEGNAQRYLDEYNKAFGFTNDDAVILEDFLANIESQNKRHYAQGGAVQTNKNTTPPDYVQAIIALLSTEPAHG